MAYVEEGIAFKTACEAEGISERLGHEWLAKGESGAEPYGHFYAALTRGRARGEILLHRKVVAGGKGSSNAEWVLERRFRDHYGAVTKVVTATDDLSNKSIEELDAERRRLLAKAAALEP